MPQAKRRRRELRRFWEGLEHWIWLRRPNTCTHAGEYATYTEIPDDDPFWCREVWEARLGPCPGGWLDSSEGLAAIAKAIPLHGEKHGESPHAQA
jgi:hypothetical protein